MARNFLYMGGVIFFQNSGIGILLVFIPVLGKIATDSLIDVGIMAGTFYMAQFLSSAYFGKLSDKKRNRLLFLRAGFAMCAITFGISYFGNESVHLFISMVGTGIAAGIMVPAILAYIYESQTEKQKSASIMSFSTLGLLAGILVTGAINSENEIFLVISAMFLAGFVTSLKLMPNKVKIEDSVSIIKIFRNNKGVYLATLFRHTGSMAVLTVTPLFLIEKLEASLLEVSLVYVVFMLASFLSMLWMSAKSHIPYLLAFRIGIGLCLVGFSGMAFASEWWEIVPFMLFGGVSWAFLYVGASLYLMEDNPKSTSVGIFNSMLALSSILASLIAGVLAFGYGYESVTWFMVAMTIAALCLTVQRDSKKAKSVNPP